MKSADRAVVLFQSILCPVDFSTHSRVALEHAVAIAQRTGGHLTTMYADDPLLATAAAVKFDDQLLTKQATREMRRLLTRVGARIDHDPGLFSVLPVVGRPADEILKAASRNGADLIVMGTQGRRGAGRMVFGSVTDRVLRETTVPVLALPPGVPTRATKSRPGRRILCAVELGPQDCADVQAASRVAKAFDTDLVLVHVVTPSAGPPWLNRSLRRHDRIRLKASHTRLDELARCARTTSGVRVESRTLLGNPAEEISAAAADLDAGLIVLTLRCGRGLFGARQGSTTYQVLCGAATPVLALHQGSRQGHKP